ncbi:MAG: phosphatase PAP2 family protein [Betaproteobacteria bacterium]|nr:MAG: phosphatase PAP2 family protein [Betaproteobacteria bacterium]
MHDDDPDSARRRWLKQTAFSTATVALSTAVPLSATAQSQTAVRALPSETNRAKGRASFAKTIAHDSKGEVSAAARDAMEQATASGRVADWESLPVQSQMRLVNPLAGYGWEKDPLRTEVTPLPPFPALDSKVLAEQALELYWMALLRDVPLWDYGRNSVVRDAVAELSKTELFAGVTASTLFRLGLPGENSGHFISQLLWMPIPYGAHTLWQAYRTPFRGTDFMTTFDEYVKVIRGDWPPGILNHYSENFYLRSGRDLGEYVRWDFSNQAFVNAASILLGNPHRPRENWPATNPYKTSRTMNGFVSMGPAFIHNAMGSVSDAAMRACWYEKWIGHRALRPEEFGALVDRTVRGETLGIHPLVVNSEAVKRVRAKYGSALLPQAYPEGAPAHPAYPSGHASIAGACVTVLKAMFEEARELRFPLQPTRDGKDWEALSTDLPKPTVGAELNKLASNMSVGRNIAGVHWHSDAMQGLLLGERVAIAWLKSEKAKSVEAQQGWAKGFEFVGFNGKRVVI